MSGPFDLFASITKYMKFMAFVRTASPLTLRAYWLDLRQAYHLPDEALMPGWGPQRGGQFQAEGEPFKHSGPSYSEEELLQRTRAAFQAWVDLSPASRNRKAATLKSFLSWAYGEKLTVKDLSERIASPKVPKRLPHYLSVDEILSVLATFRDEQQDLLSLREQTLVLLLYGGGLRVSEACRLQWKDIDFPRRLLRVMGKGSKERLSPLPQKSFEMIRRLRETDPSSLYVFGEQALNPRVAYEWVRSRGQKAGLLNGLHPHALRHSYATHLLSQGANLRTLQELLGHESLSATEKYTHLGIDQLARTLERTHPLGEKKRA